VTVVPLVFKKRIDASSQKLDSSTSKSSNEMLSLESDSIDAYGVFA
jgi:hypothetical protein